MEREVVYVVVGQDVVLTGFWGEEPARKYREEIFPGDEDVRIEAVEIYHSAREAIASQG